MPLPNRHNINSYLTPEILNAFSAWLVAYDEEGVEGQDETTIKPNDIGDPGLPGYVVADVAFADGTATLGLLGGDSGVALFDEADDLRLYYDEVVWQFSLRGEGDSCKQDWPAEPAFFDKFRSRLPLRVTPRLVDAFGTDASKFVFTISADGALRVVEVG